MARISISSDTQHLLSPLQCPQWQLPPGLCSSVLWKLCPETPQQHHACAHTHQQWLLPQPNKLWALVWIAQKLSNMYARLSARRGVGQVPQAIFWNVKLEERLSYPNMTKQGLPVHLTTLPETPGIYLHYVCLSKGEMLAQALDSGACSSSSPPPPSPASPSDVAGGRTSLPHAQGSACLPVYGEQENKWTRFIIAQGQGGTGHIKMGQSGRGVKTEAQIRPMQTKTSLSSAAMTDSLLSLKHSHAIMAWHIQNDRSPGTYDFSKGYKFNNTQPWSPSSVPTSGTWVTRVRSFPDGLSSLKAATFLLFTAEGPGTHLMLLLYLQSTLKIPLEQDIAEQTSPACSPLLAAPKDVLPLEVSLHPGKEVHFAFCSLPMIWIHVSHPARESLMWQLREIKWSANSISFFSQITPIWEKTQFPQTSATHSRKMHYRHATKCEIDF